MLKEGTNGKFVAHTHIPTSPTAHSKDASNGVGSGERDSSEAAIDPLSQVSTNRVPRKAHHEADRASSIQQILKRTNTAQAIQKLRAQNTDSYAAHSQTSLHDATPDKKHSGETPHDPSASTKADRK